MSHLVGPHGADRLLPRLVPAESRADELERARSLPTIPLTSREVSDLLMLAIGAYTPLDGFMGEADWRRVCTEMRLADGLFWPIPVTLSVDGDAAAALAPGIEVALSDGETGRIMATMEVRETYRIDKGLECREVFRTEDPEHPGVAKVLEQGAVNVAGPVRVLDEGDYPVEFEGLYMRPAESRALFAARGWSRVAAFQTRNPMHRSHEHLVKIAAEVSDGVFIHQVLGRLKPGDIPAAVRTRAIAALIDAYFVAGTVIQAGYPIEMRYAGPREALLHAVIRQNFGCSHLIVGRDHAGVGKYYGPLDAQHIFDELWDGALETRPLRIDNTFYCRRCAGMATGRTCPHGDSDRVLISGTRVREMLSGGEDIPPEFSRPEVVAVLRDYYRRGA